MPSHLSLTYTLRLSQPTSSPVSHMLSTTGNTSYVLFNCSSDASHRLFQSTAHIAFRLADDATGTGALLTDSLSCAPASHPILTQLPAVWNPGFRAQNVSSSAQTPITTITTITKQGTRQSLMEARPMLGRTSYTHERTPWAPHAWPLPSVVVVRPLLLPRSGVPSLL